MTENSEEQYTNKVPWLKPYQYPPGESGNAGGRPKGTSITAELRKIIAEPGKAKSLAEVLISIAENPHNKYQLAAIEMALNRADGKVKDVLSVEPGDVTLAVALKLMDMVRRKQIGDNSVQRQIETEESSLGSSEEA